MTHLSSNQVSGYGTWANREEHKEMVTRRKSLQAMTATAAAFAMAGGVRAATSAAPIVERWRETLPRIETDIRAWDTILDHRTGTAGDRQTADWLALEIERAGARPEIVEFPFTRRIPRRASVSDGIRRIDGLPLFDSAATSIDLRATAGPLGSDSAIGVTLFGPGGGDERALALESARLKGSHQAIVAIAAGDIVEPGLSVQNAEHYARPIGPAVLQVPTEAADWLLEAARLGQPLTLEIEVELEQTTACNVQTRIDGLRGELAPLVVMTPRSAWWTCTAERAGGISLWLNAIRHFARQPGDRALICTANTGHELGHVGLNHYLASAQSLIREAHAWIHLGANFASRNAPIRYQASTADLMAAGLAAIRARGIVDIDITPTGSRPLGEARNIHDGGGQYLSLLGGNRWFHHPEDRWPASVDLEKTGRLNEAMLEQMIALAHG